MEADILTSFEVEHYVRGLEEIDVREYASPKWNRQHEVIYKLNLQSHRNARAREDEYVKEAVIMNEKMRTLIYDLIVSEVWKTNVLPLCHQEMFGLSSVRSYMLIYHEGVVANLLEILLYHRTACEESGDYLIDVVDWAYRKLIKITQVNETGERVTGELTRAEELEHQLKELEFSMGISSISIIRFISDHMEGMTLALVQHLVEQCDIFCVLVPLMEMKPWIRNKKGGKMIFEDQQWRVLRDEAKIPQVEAQIWLTIYNLFMNQDVRSKYELTSYRKNNILRIRKFLNEVVIDQIPVLSQLLRALEELSIVGDTTIQSGLSAFVIQQLPELYQNISAGKNWREIAEYQKSNFLIENDETRKADMQLLMAGIEEILDDPICTVCSAPASKRCSKCKSQWYCSRKCQVSAWKEHKIVCESLSEELSKKETQNTKPKSKIEELD